MTNARSAGEMIAYVSTTVIAIGILWRYIVRPVWSAWRKFKAKVHVALDVIDRELTHNGGGSLKDAVHRTDRNVAVLDAEVGQLKTQGTDTKDAVEALAQVMDNVVDRKQEDHARIWEAIVAMGGEDLRHRKDH